MNKRYRVNSEEIDRLRGEVEHFAGCPMQTPDDFIRLSNILNSSGYGYVSPTTLKRVWGYITDTGNDYCPGTYTLRTLSNLLGFRDFNEFADQKLAIQSKEYTGQYLESRGLEIGAKIEIRWQPNRHCILRHMNDSLFEVLSSENARLKKGDIVECGCFTQNAPAYFTRVFRQGASPMTYIAGTANGISFCLLES